MVFAKWVNHFFQNYSWSSHLFWVHGCLCFWAVCPFSAGQLSSCLLAGVPWGTVEPGKPPRRPRSLCPEGPGALILSPELSESSTLCQGRRRTLGPSEDLWPDAGYTAGWGTAGSNHKPKDSKAKMPPEAMVAHPSLCRMKTETQREDWSSQHQTHILPPPSCLRLYWPLIKARTTLGKGSLGSQCRSIMDYLPARAGCGQWIQSRHLPGCWSFPGAAAYLSCKALLPGLWNVCPLTGNSQPPISSNRVD